LAILIIGFVMKSWWGLIGLIPLFTGIISFCALYPLCGMNTCKTTEAKQ
jgi:hypothetical protein